MSPGRGPSHGMRGASTRSTPMRIAAAPRTIRKRPRSCIIPSMPHEPGGEKHRATVRASFDKQAAEFSESPVMTDAAALARLVAWARLAGGERVVHDPLGPGLPAAPFPPHRWSGARGGLPPPLLAPAAAVVGRGRLID